MATATVSTRLDEDDLDLLEMLCQASGLDRSAIIKSLLRRGMSEMRLEIAADQFRKNQITLSRGAELAGISTWDFIGRMDDFGLDLHYDSSDFEEDLDALKGGG